MFRKKKNEPQKEDKKKVSMSRQYLIAFGGIGSGGLSAISPETKEQVKHLQSSLENVENINIDDDGHMVEYEPVGIYYRMKKNDEKGEVAKSGSAPD